MATIDLAAWRTQGHTTPATLAQLQRVAALQRASRAGASLGLTGQGRQAVGTDYAGVERSRMASLAAIEAIIASGKFDESLSAVDYLYALNLLYNPASLLADAAEVETRRFLYLISGGNLLDLTEAKGVNQEGPDGLFVGGIPALGIPSWGGIEVKSAVSNESLSGNLNRMIKAMGTKDYTVWRRLSHGLAVAKLRALGQHDLADTLNFAGPLAFSTLLVVRASSFEDLKVPAIAYQVFNLVLRFDLFGYPVWDESLARLPGWAYDDLYNFAGNYNVEKAKVSLAQYQAFL